jgi:hypothetical protein
MVLFYHILPKKEHLMTKLTKNSDKDGQNRLLTVKVTMKYLLLAFVAVVLTVLVNGCGGDSNDPYGGCVTVDTNVTWEEVDSYFGDIPQVGPVRGKIVYLPGAYPRVYYGGEGEERCIVCVDGVLDPAKVSEGRPNDHSRYLLCCGAIMFSDFWPGETQP